jgi:acyl-CoA thioesterase
MNRVDPYFTGPHEVKLEKWVSCAPFEELLGIKIIEASEGHAHLSMPFAFKLAQGKGLAHGGAIVILADTAVAMGIKSILPPNSHFGTISLNAEFLAPVTKGTLEAKATVKFLENRMVQGVATVFNEDNRDVLKFSALFKLAKDVTVETKQDKETKISSLMDHVRNAAKLAAEEDSSDIFNAMSWLDLELEDHPESFDRFFDIPWNELTDSQRERRNMEIRRLL